MVNLSIEIHDVKSPFRGLDFPYKRVGVDWS